jgi:light-regulated signal transduction histidine kinase (bacteriophytochrome)
MEQECLHQVRDGSERMEILLRDLTTYIEACGYDRVATTVVDAEACLNEALANLAITIRETEAHITFDPLPSLHVDAMRLQQVFQNLIGNAIKYRKPGVAPRIHVRAERQGSMWRFSVRDNGIGIAPVFHTQIFGLFKRLHTRQKYAGTGIGLALCARIVNQYHGRIWVESELGDGATFHFTLPA